MRHRPLKLSVKEQVKVKDRNDTWKMWFNGAKHFFTVKLLPPRK